MSKERLEEIKQRLVLLHNAADVDDETKSYIFEYLKVEWLIERVQELEDIVYQDERQAVLEGLYEQNKRYREALERIAYDDELLSNTDDIIAAKEALEGEE